MKYGASVLLAGTAVVVMAAAATLATGPADDVPGGEVGPPPLHWQPSGPVGPPPADWRPPAPDGWKNVDGRALDDAQDRGLTAVATQGSLNALSGNQYTAFGDEFWLIETDDGWRFVVVGEEHNLTVHDLTNGQIEAQIQISGGDAATFIRTISETAPIQHWEVTDQGGPTLEPVDCIDEDECGTQPGEDGSWWAWCWCLANCTCSNQNRDVCSFNGNECSFICCDRPVAEIDDHFHTQ